MKNKELLTRFELFVDGEAQNIGFLRGIEDTGLSEDRQAGLVYNLDKKMSMPSIHDYKSKSNASNIEVKSFFRDKGLKDFKNDIENIISSIDEDGLFSVGKIEVLLDNQSVNYVDEHQVLMDFPNINTLTYSLVDVSTGIYTFNELNPNGLFDKHVLIKINNNVDIINCIKITPNCLEENIYYYVDFNNNIVQVFNN